MIEHLLDRTVVNVDALLSNAGGTVMDVLAKSPGVQVNENNVINLQGKAVKIYIDDRPTYLSGDDLANYLRSLPSSNIDRLELMSTPPAKYEAAGNGGIINIRTKRIAEKGFNGNLNLAYVQGVYGRSNNGLNLNYRQTNSMSLSIWVTTIMIATMRLTLIAISTKALPVLRPTFYSSRSAGIGVTATMGA
ncbi:hypothetical protein FO440_09775 [Mucilaginibacter corticis]|uniref:TonB-dependent receptor plug domain-containing protein n=1 Tax=Mucilaginibacter corticis TaxID=2597670 RepID=A0A556MWY3_9SPHI|nr:TonB-dependent receptor plug domain-containing protein [Mucilaginibacter corticis]TSJ44444.1 hypothetical protein FO440_09775 [Mucilaginibacter corticis]